VFVVKLPGPDKIQELERQAAQPTDPHDTDDVKSTRKRQIFFYNLQEEGEEEGHGAVENMCCRPSSTVAAGAACCAPCRRHPRVGGGQR